LGYTTIRIEKVASYCFAYTAELHQVSAVG